MLINGTFTRIFLAVLMQPELYVFSSKQMKAGSRTDQTLNGGREANISDSRRRRSVKQVDFVYSYSFAGLRECDQYGISSVKRRTSKTDKTTENLKPTQIQRWETWAD